MRVFFAVLLPCGAAIPLCAFVSDSGLEVQQHDITLRNYTFHREAPQSDHNASNSTDSPRLHRSTHDGDSTLSNSSSSKGVKRLAYVNRITSDAYACAALQLHSRLVRLNMDASRVDLVCLHTRGVSQLLIAKAKKQLNIRAVQVDAIRAAARNRTWRNSLTKLRVFLDWGYDRVVYLDADAAPVRNLDHLFDLSPGTLSAPTVCRIKQPFLASTLMVIEPSSEVFGEMLACALARGSTAGIDMGILIAFFADSVVHLPGQYTVLNSDFRQPSTVRNSLFDTVLELKQHAKVVHFSCKLDGSYGKPWLWPSRSLALLDSLEVDPLFGELFEAYWRGEKRLCGS